MVRDDAPTEDALEQERIMRDRELESDRRDVLYLAWLANRRRRTGQGPELLDAYRGPPRAAVIWAVGQRHLAHDTVQQRVDVARWHERGDPVHAVDRHGFLSFWLEDDRDDPGWGTGTAREWDRSDK
jgi:hypothetical protein